MKVPYTQLTDDDVCVVCYSSLRSLKDEREDGDKECAVAIQCSECESTQCMACTADWAVASIEELHIPDTHHLRASGHHDPSQYNNSIDDLFKLKCAQRNCNSVLSI